MALLYSIEGLKTSPMAGILERMRTCLWGNKTYVEVTIPSLRVESGRMYALIGPSGAGKSVVMSLLCGYPPLRNSQTVTCESFRVFDFKIGDVVREKAASFFRNIRKKAGLSKVFYLPQILSNDKSLSVPASAALKDVAEALMGRRFDRGCEKRLLESLRSAGLSDVWNRRLTTLSGGERRRLELLIRLAVVREVKARQVVVILDEPTTGFDAQSREHFFCEIRETLNALTRDGVECAFVIATHAMNYLTEKFFDSVVFVQREKAYVGGKCMGCAVVGQVKCGNAEKFAKRILPQDMQFSWENVFERFDNMRTIDVLNVLLGHGRGNVT